MSASPIRIALQGVGKIARDQHFPAIAANPDFALTATVSRHPAGLDDIPHFSDLDALIAHGPAVDAVALCTPPQVRYALAARAIEAGLHVFLEKPPGATLSEVIALQGLADAAGVTLFASWHSRYAAGVEPARQWLAERRIEHVSIIWREDVRVWHPGQDWIWQPGGLGVFDPGINALSILTQILPNPVFLKDATLQFPENRAAPIAADLRLSDTLGTPIHMDLDWRQTGPQSWDIIVETDAGTVHLAKGGAVLSLPKGTVESPDVEYPGLYARFAKLVRDGRSDVDTAPLCIVADSFLRGQRVQVEAFED
ncbi:MULTISPECIES: Gfo/Idh/MocA family protein [unclassified Sphingobium]|uniref:Gfo/Idh/MocA family protein n=1 Tax=unclassified Sphingobium TaxID=2611147 RepID=UPI0022240B8F|nr:MULTISPECIES: Gfo/Idh/MocA family oxidoreductase [unclassified Sphingobium]MCW2395022.1 D-galactose 1-dehydrogenase [Sphingobium sp. B8D3B]MCW2411643.1 D-galactose 1-dehydrogenase [Sphingobium sp. B8D3D]MCW2416064.1 D-galactose 1-dehydrogenase [Sphingobium sp. B8D3A]MCW2418536.1 D-galactose 1-dehydrogenase [Sphingobium sp. B8D3C]